MKNVWITALLIIIVCSERDREQAYGLRQRTILGQLIKLHCGLLVIRNTED